MQYLLFLSCSPLLLRTPQKRNPLSSHHRDVFSPFLSFCFSFTLFLGCLEADPPLRFITSPPLVVFFWMKGGISLFFFLIHAGDDDDLKVDDGDDDYERWDVMRDELRWRLSEKLIQVQHVLCLFSPPPFIVFSFFFWWPQRLYSLRFGDSLSLSPYLSTHFFLCWMDWIEWCCLFWSSGCWWTFSSSFISMMIKQHSTSSTV